MLNINFLWSPTDFFIVLPYPSAYFALEFSILVSLALVEALRIVNGWKANLTEDTTFMAISILLFIPGMLGIIYFLLWQVMTLGCKFHKQSSYLCIYEHFYQFVFHLLDKFLISDVRIEDRNDILWCTTDYPRTSTPIFDDLYHILLWRDILSQLQSYPSQL